MASERLILETLARMEKYYGRTLDPDVRLMYVDRLKSLEESSFKNAAVILIDSFQQTSTKPFPLIADFLSACGEDGRTRAINIVGAVRKACELGQYVSVDFGDRALHNVIMRYGGWLEIVNNDHDMWWSLHERNFIAAYESARSANIEGPAHLEGLVELENRKNGFPFENPYRVCSKSGNVLTKPVPNIATMMRQQHEITNNSPKQLVYRPTLQRKTVREILKSDVGRIKIESVQAA